MKKIVFLIVCLLFCVEVNASTTAKKVEFVRCVDGDTAVFKQDGEELKYRFIAIDTPETVHPTKEVEAFGKDASEYTCNKLTNASEIFVEYENNAKTDKYGRNLAWIWVDGSLLQEELVSAGYAKVAYIYAKYRYTESLCIVQNDALTEGYGIWSDATEVGYCDKVDITSKTNIIDFSKIHDITEETSVNQKNNNITKKKSSNSSNSDNIFSLEFLENRINKYLDKHEEIVAVVAVVSLFIGFLFKSIKK